MPRVTRTLILSGGGDFTDPWHPFLETSQRIASVLTELGHDVEIDTKLSAAADRLRAAAPDLLVINAGNAEQPSPIDDDLIAAVSEHLAAGRPLLVMHVASTAFPQVDAWEDIVGGRWVRGTTMHPDWADSLVHVDTGTHAITRGIHDFQIMDEMYSYMRTADDVRALAWHDYEGVRHPLLWARERGPARVVYDALGHNAESFDAPEHRALLANSARWLLREL
jgi:type 1 glutamine amidotransferase